ncbi:MAG: hypothetical protein ACYC4R_11885 [Anaerolineae bacterium]
MQCPEVTELMSLSLDMPLEAHDEEFLQEHLAACHDCTQTWMRMQTLSSLLAAAPAIPAPPLFTQAVLERIQRRETWGALLRRSTLLIIGLFVLATAGTFLVAGISSLAWQILGNPSSADTFAGVFLRLADIIGSIVRAATLVPRTVLIGTNPALVVAYIAAAAALVLWWVKLIARPVSNRSW